jgi:hypothetical protein
VAKSGYPTSTRHKIAAEEAEDADVRFRKKSIAGMDDALSDNVLVYDPCYLKRILRRERWDDASLFSLI